MSPVSRGRRKAKSSRIVRRVPTQAIEPDLCDCPACVGASDPEALVANLASAGADLLTVENPIEAEMLGANLVATVAIAGDGLVEALAEGVVPALASSPTPESLALLMAIVAVENRVGTDEIRRLREAGVPAPRWAEALSEPVKPGVSRRYEEPTGESSVLLCTFERSGHSHGFVLWINHVRCDAAVNIVMFPGEALEQAHELILENGRLVGTAFTVGDLDPAELRWQVERAISARAVHDEDAGMVDFGDGYDKSGRPDYHVLAVLLRARIGLLPEPSRPPAPHGRSVR